MLLKRAQSNERRGKGVGGGGAVLPLVFTFDCHSIGGREICKCDAIQMKPFEQQMTLFIYLSHFKMKFRIIQILTIQTIGLLTVIMTLMKYLNSDHPFYKP